MTSFPLKDANFPTPSKFENVSLALQPPNFLRGVFTQG